LKSSPSGKNGPSGSPDDMPRYKLTKFDIEKQKEIEKLDKSLKNISIPVILLERLKKEFDDSHYLS